MYGDQLVFAFRKAVREMMGAAAENVMRGTITDSGEFRAAQGRYSGMRICLDLLDELEKKEQR